jgi:hypothetical protein
MLPLRNETPKRRIITKEVPHWTAHKPDLRLDFNHRCGYCNSFDGFRHTYFEVDHFVPKVFFKISGKITLNQYGNLVYTCKYCNNNKLSKWPSKSETIFHDGKEGFVDPCDDEYDSHFYRTVEGAIMWRTELGKWMYKEAFKFDEREKSIKLLWNLDRLRLIIPELSEELEKLPQSSPLYHTLKNKIGEFSFTYVQYHKELMEYYR